MMLADKINQTLDKVEKIEHYFSQFPKVDIRGNEFVEVPEEAFIPSYKRFGYNDEIKEAIENDIPVCLLEDDCTYN